MGNIGYSVAASIYVDFFIILITKNNWKPQIY